MLRLAGPVKLNAARVCTVLVCALANVLHFGFQGTGAHTAIQGNSEAGRVPGDEFLAVFLTFGQ